MLSEFCQAYKFFFKNSIWVLLNFISYYISFLWVFCPFWLVLLCTMRALLIDAGVHWSHFWLSFMCVLKFMRFDNYWSITIVLNYSIVRLSARLLTNILLSKAFIDYDSVEVGCSVGIHIFRKVCRYRINKTWKSLNLSHCKTQSTAKRMVRRDLQGSNDF